jgi:acyl-CoA thioester hydrolase
MSGFSTQVALRIEWIDIDHFGHVNNLAILRYVQAARVHYLEAVGLMQSHEETKTGPILASTSCQFRKPLFYPGQVTVRSKVDGIKNTSFRIRHSIYNDKDEIFAEAEDIIVLFDFRKKIKLAIPDQLREKIKQMEGRKDGSAHVTKPEPAQGMAQEYRDCSCPGIERDRT